MPPAFEFRGKRRSSGGGRSRPEHEFTFRSRAPRTATRPLLTSQRETTPELVGVQQDESQGQRKFLPLEQVSDSEETDMQMSADENGDGEGPSRKRQAVESTSGAPQPAPAPAPKWSNPDPYTVLPPADEPPAKKKDVVKMIRKAKVQAEADKAKEEPKNEVVANADFISFDMEDLSHFMPPEDAPTGPKNDRKRTHDEAMGRPKREPKFYKSDGSVLDKWLPVKNQSPTPWIIEEEADTVIPANRLHNEILQFYDWVKPRYYENIVRSDLIQRL
ncbi:hypothetical protein KEM55_002508, partial [Ascosphaera atra]